MAQCIVRVCLAPGMRAVVCQAFAPAASAIAIMQFLSQAKRDFVWKMLEFSGASSPSNIVDVGCGFGGSSRALAANFPDASVTGVTLSPQQVKRGTELADERCAPQPACPTVALVCTA
jgi:cyclopropane fatty-acyl-phospholipid synthase-like methyltransferase